MPRHFCPLFSVQLKILIVTDEFSDYYILGDPEVNLYLGGGFEKSFISMIQFDEHIFSEWVGSTTN